MKYKDITVDDVKFFKSLMSYNEFTGKFTWTNPLSRRVKKGDLAGRLSNGYVGIGISGNRWQAHRLAVAFVDGSLSGGVEIDHEDHDRSNNRISNLRKVSRTDNSRNFTLVRNNKSGVMGVHLHKGMYDASITINYQKFHIGRFSDWFDAVCARRSAENKIGFHSNHGR